MLDADPMLEIGRESRRASALEIELMLEIWIEIELMLEIELNDIEWERREIDARDWSRADPVLEISEGGMIRLETLVELKFLNSSFSSLSSYWN